jgi:hypothetical protein
VPAVTTSSSSADERGRAGLRGDGGLERVDRAGVDLADDRVAELGHLVVEQDRVVALRAARR